jgi:hypothetical protein
MVTEVGVVQPVLASEGGGLMASYPAILVDHLCDILDEEGYYGCWVVPRPNGVFLVNPDVTPRCFVEFVQSIELDQQPEQQQGNKASERLQKALFNAAEEVVETYEISSCGEDTDALDLAIGHLRMAMLPLYGEEDELAVTGDRLLTLTRRQYASLVRSTEAARRFCDTNVFQELRQGNKSKSTMVTFYTPGNGENVTGFSVDDRETADELWASLRDVEY